MNILVLAGGYSTERNVSLCTGAMVTKALRDNGHRVALIDSYVGVKDKECDLEALYKKEIPENWKNISKEEPDLD